MQNSHADTRAHIHTCTRVHVPTCQSNILCDPLCAAPGRLRATSCVRSLPVPASSPPTAFTALPRSFLSSHGLCTPRGPHCHLSRLSACAGASYVPLLLVWILSNSSACSAAGLPSHLSDLAALHIWRACWLWSGCLCCGGAACGRSACLTQKPVACLASSLCFGPKVCPFQASAKPPVGGTAASSPSDSHLWPPCGLFPPAPPHSLLCAPTPLGMPLLVLIPVALWHGAPCAWLVELGLLPCW